MEWATKAVAAIEEQQKAVKEESAVWMVGEQLKDICRREPAAAEIICQDLSVKEMSITAAEKQIKAWADKHKVGNFACVTPMRAERILREFYKVNWPEGAREGGMGHKLPEMAAPAVALDEAKPEPKKPGRVLDLSDFL